MTITIESAPEILARPCEQAVREDQDVAAVAAAVLADAFAWDSEGRAKPEGG